MALVHLTVTVVFLLFLVAVTKALELYFIRRWDEDDGDYEAGTSPEKRPEPHTVRAERKPQQHQQLVPTGDLRRRAMAQALNQQDWPSCFKVKGATVSPHHHRARSWEDRKLPAGDKIERREQLRKTTLPTRAKLVNQASQEQPGHGRVPIRFGSTSSLRQERTILPFESMRHIPQERTIPPSELMGGIPQEETVDSGVSFNNRTNTFGRRKPPRNPSAPLKMGGVSGPTMAANQAFTVSTQAPQVDGLGEWLSIKSTA
ncbi:hypothetical protein B0T10DRAFT_262844 [Thelonectria olida]|uniref:Secreted protein n=1 Tax=Thelonectria olida TaxID=1576542 RepID=A0A9P9AS17_9HYPO|nr:hypothetical protein B0T10DRAFT_262844 [Thelonectria olida]